MAYEKEIKSISTSMAENIAKAGKKTIAVVDFTDLQGNVTELGRFIAEEFSVALAGAGKGFEVVDRTHLKSIIAEHKLSATGIIDPQTARKLGQIAGVDAIITGTITPFGDSMRLSVKILDTATAKIIGASSGDIAKTKAIEELLAKGIEPVPPTPVPGPPTKAQQRVEAKDFIFDLQGCKLAGQTVTCSLSITNKGKDRELIINPRQVTRIFTDSGDEYQSKEVKLSNKQGTWVRSLLVSGIPTKSGFTFEEVSAQGSMLALLEIDCGSEGDFTVQFRNIQLTK
jgi:TolB-like protein